MLHARVGDPHKLTLVGLTGIDLVQRAPAVGGVHEAVVDQRVDFVLRTVLTRVLHPAQRQGPDHPEVPHVVTIDLGELRVPLRAVVAVHQQPVLRLVLCVDQTIAADRERVLPLQRDDSGHHDGAHQSGWFHPPTSSLPSRGRPGRE